MSYVVRIEDPAFLDTPTGWELFCDAFPPGNDVIFAPFEEAEERFRKMIQSPNIGLFVAIHDGEAVALSLLMLPGTKFDGPPQFVMIYNKGPRDAKRQVLDAGVDFLRVNGYMSFRAVNVTDRPDSIWARAFRSAGEARKVGSIMEFSIGQRSAEPVRGVGAGE
jgi:hypothetical protein